MSFPSRRTITFTAPSRVAMGESSSKYGMTSFLYGIVTFSQRDIRSVNAALVQSVVSVVLVQSVANAALVQSAESIVLVQSRLKSRLHSQ